MKRLIDSPSTIKPIPYGWDPAVRGALAHAKGAGHPLPEPLTREWRFENGLGVRTTSNRAMLVAGIVADEAVLIDVFTSRPLNPIEAVKRGFAAESVLTEALGPDELEAFLQEVKAHAPR